MKRLGILYKESDKWWVKYYVENVDISSNPAEVKLSSFWEKLRLHPDDEMILSMIEENIDTLEARVAASPDVEFEEVDMPALDGNPYEPRYFAKLSYFDTNQKPTKND
jgi:hypothetical protein